MITDNNFVKFKVCSNHIVENKKILSFLLKEFIQPYNSFPLREVEDSFLNYEVMKKQGREVIRILEAEATYKPRDYSEFLQRVHLLSQPGRNRLNELIVSVYPKAESKDEILKITEEAYKETQKLYGSYGFYKNGVFNKDGLFMSKVINFFVVVFPKCYKNEIISNNEKDLKFNPLNYPVDRKFESFKGLLPVYGFLLGPYDKNVPYESLRLLDLIFSGSHTVTQKKEILEKDFGIVLEGSEEEDLTVITSYCLQVLQESEPKQLL